MLSEFWNFFLFSVSSRHFLLQGQGAQCARAPPPRRNAPRAQDGPGKAQGNGRNSPNHPLPDPSATPREPAARTPGGHGGDRGPGRGGRPGRSGRAIRAESRRSSSPAPPSEHPFTFPFRPLPAPSGPFRTENPLFRRGLRRHGVTGTVKKRAALDGNLCKTTACLCQFRRNVLSSGTALVSGLRHGVS